MWFLTPNQDVLYQDMVSGRLDATLQDAIMVDAGFLKSAKGKGFAFAGNNVGRCQNTRCRGCNRLA